MARMRAIGADGCRAGRVVAAGKVDRRGSLGTITIAVVPDFASVLKFRGDRVVVDMPIGPPETWAPGGRVCGVEARALLGPGRGSSVFPGPPRASLDLATFERDRARVVVEIDRSAGVERLTRHWAALREVNDGRRHLLVHLVRARRGTGEAERRAAWDFVAARMDDDLARAGRRRPRGWDVVRLEWGPEAEHDPVEAVAGHLRRVLDLDWPQDGGIR